MILLNTIVQRATKPPTKIHLLAVRENCWKPCISILIYYTEKTPVKTAKLREPGSRLVFSKQFLKNFRGSQSSVTQLLATC